MQLLQRRIHAFSHERGWLKNVRPASYVKSIIIEAAELLEAFQWSHPTAKQLLLNPKALSVVKRELADVLIYCINLANLLGLDIEEIIEEKMEYNDSKYPADLLKEDPSMYLQIKHSYRRWEL